MTRETRQDNKTTNQKGIIVGMIALFVLAICACLAIYGKYSEKPVGGAKSISVDVINAAQETVSYELETNQEYLLEALQEIDELTLEGEDGPYGLMITTINGEFAEYNTNQAYWSFYVNEEYCNYGVAEQPIEDGDEFQIVFTPAN